MLRFWVVKAEFGVLGLLEVGYRMVRSDLRGLEMGISCLGFRVCVYIYIYIYIHTRKIPAYSFVCATYMHIYI